MKRAALLSVLFAAGAMSVDAEPLGRLFFTPEQRAQLDRQRQRGSAGRAPAATLRLDGVVFAPGGRTTAWINGRLRRDADRAEVADLRVGESINLVTREKSDVVAPGAIRAGRSPAP